MHRTDDWTFPQCLLSSLRSDRCADSRSEADSSSSMIRLTSCSARLMASAVIPYSWRTVVRYRLFRWHRSKRRTTFAMTDRTPRASRMRRRSIPSMTDPFPIEVTRSFPVLDYSDIIATPFHAVKTTPSAAATKELLKLPHDISGRWSANRIMAPNPTQTVNRCPG